MIDWWPADWWPDFMNFFFFDIHSLGKVTTSTVQNWEKQKQCFSLLYEFPFIWKSFLPHWKCVTWSLSWLWNEICRMSVWRTFLAFALRCLHNSFREGSGLWLIWAAVRDLTQEHNWHFISLCSRRSLSASGAVVSTDFSKCLFFMFMLRLECAQVKHTSI